MAKKTIEEWVEELGDLSENKQWEELLALSEEAIREWPKKALGYFSRGWAKNELSRHEDAIKDLDVAIELKPNYAAAYNVRGFAKNELGRHEDAIKDLDVAIELEPNHAGAYNNRGFAKSKLGRYDEAIKDFDKAIELEPENISFHHNRALVFGRREASKTSRKVEETYREQIKSITDPILITEFYAREIEQSEMRLYGNNDGQVDPFSTETESGGNQGGDGQDGVSNQSGGGSWPPFWTLYVILVIVAMASVFAYHIFTDLSSPELKLNWRFIIAVAVTLAAVLCLIVRRLVYIQITTTTSWMKQYERASASLRIFIFILWVVVLSFFALLNFFDEESSMKDFINLGNIFPISTSLIFLATPLFLYVGQLRRRNEQELVRLHSMRREYIVMLFWTVQSNDNEVTNKSKMVPDILTQLTTNSTADLSMKMLNSRFGQKPKDEDADEISLSRLSRILKIVKKHNSSPK